MNVLQLVPKLDIGGVERGTVEVARFLTLNGHKAVVVSGGGRLEKKLAAAGVRHYTLPVGEKDPVKMWYCYYQLRHIIREENIDIIHARSRVPALTGYLASRSEHRAFITTAHGQYKKHLMSRVMGWGKSVIVASDVMARHMKENFDVLPHRIVVIPRGVDREQFSFIPPSARQGKTFRVGMISRFTPLKGHLDFLKAAAYVSRKVPKLEIILMGDRASARQDYLRKIELTTRHLLIDKIVKFKDPDEDVAAVLKELDVLVSASKGQEAFGRAVIEAQARGVTVVATRVGGVTETVEDGVTGLLCEPDDPLDMSDKIVRCADNPELREKIAENARENVEKKFSLDTMLRSTVEVYENVLNMKEILILKTSSLGDVILSVPSIRAIRKRFPGALIKILVDVKYRKVVERCPYIDEVIVCDFKGRDRGPGLLKPAERLKSEGFDISVDLQNSRRSHLLAFLGAIPERYAYDNHKLSFLANRKIRLPQGPLGPVEHQARILRLLGIHSFEKHLELWPDKESDEWVSRFLEANWVKKGQKLVGISMSASKKWRTKNWGISCFQRLSEMLAREHGIRVVLLGTADDMPGAEEFVRTTAAKPINAVGKTDIPGLISLISRCNALVAGDSAPVHIAAAVGTPFVALFGPTDPGRHLPPAKSFRVINKKMECSPCYKRICPRAHECMTAIQPRDVVDALIDVIS
ncbi:MAG: glycosyltransferase [Candidatus Omnitrophica bacterium]|nr:glycosyltransferase [Candidatus Omnitrophota bacterium]